MFDHERFEILITELRSTHRDTLHLRDIIMATLQQVQDALTANTAAEAATAQAVTDLAARVAAAQANNVPPVATAADLDGIVASVQQQTTAQQSIQASLAAIDPAAPAPAA